VTRRVLYWAVAVVATLVFAYFTFVMMMVPGIPPSEKIVHLSIAGALLTLALGIGFWRPLVSDAPAIASPINTVVAVIIFLESLMCAAGIVSQILHPR